MLKNIKIKFYLSRKISKQVSEVKQKRFHTDSFPTMKAKSTAKKQMYTEQLLCEIEKKLNLRGKK